MTKELNILVLEDMTADVVLINHELRRGGLRFHSKRVETKKEFIYEIESNPPDVILSDHGLPTFDGFAALAIAKDKCPDTPFIFVSSSKGEELAINSMRGGAVDYVLKGNLNGLVPAINRALLVTEEQRKRREAEKALKESEERFRTLVGGVKDYALFMLDSEGRVSSWNVGAEFTLGYSTDEVMGRHLGFFYSPEDRHAGKPERDLKNAAATGRLEEDCWRVRKGGARFHANAILNALRDASGKLRGFAHVTRDVTERREAQEALYKSESRYRKLVELSPNALLVLAKEQIVFANSAGVMLLGARDTSELVGQPLGRFVHPVGGSLFLQRIRELEDTGPPSTPIPFPGVPIAPAKPVAVFAEQKFVRLDGCPVDIELAAAKIIFQDEPAVQLIAQDSTHSLKAAAALAESEARKTAMLETSLDAIICVDQLGTVREWNSAAVRIFGIERAKAIGNRLDELIVPVATRDKYLSGLSDYLVTGVGSLIGRPIELMALRAGGAEFPIELAITCTPAGKPPLFTVFIRDITGRKQAEEVLRQSEARKTAIVETAPDAIVSVDREGRITDWNPAAQRTFGFSRDLALGKELAELILLPSWKQARRAGFARHVRSQRAHLLGRHIETTAIRANGAKFPIEFAIAEMPPGNDPQAFIAHIRDIAERRRIEDALRRSEERFRLLVENVEDHAIYMLDPGGRVVTWNSGAERIEGFRAQEIVRRKFSRFNTPEEIAQGYPEKALAVAKAEGRFQDERWRVCKDGRRYWANVLVTALRDSHGALYGFSVIARDMTKRKEAEDETRRRNAELERRVRERTAELQAACDEMEAFSYSISHDLRAPLIHIGAFVDMLRRDADGVLNEKSRQHLDTIALSGAKMARMIDDLLALSRMGSAEMHKVRVDLTDVVTDVLRDWAPEIERRRIVTKIARLPAVSGDPPLLRQAVFNLVSNAVKYTGKRAGPRIEIGAKAGVPETIFFIRDNGVGFDMKYADRLFSVFGRLHGEAEFEGTGIGLANVRRIIQRHGGRVWAKGAVDGGATFYFSLPNKEEVSSEPGQVRASGGR